MAGLRCLPVLLVFMLCYQGVPVSNAHPTEPLTILSTAEIVGAFKSNIPQIENQLGQLSGKKLKAVEIVATVLHETIEDADITPENASKVLKEVITTVQNKNDAMAALKQALSASVSQELISESLSWFITLDAMHEGIDKIPTNRQCLIEFLGDCDWLGSAKT